MSEESTTPEQAISEAPATQTTASSEPTEKPAKKASRKAAAKKAAKAGKTAKTTTSSEGKVQKKGNKTKAPAENKQPEEADKNSTQTTKKQPRRGRTRGKGRQQDGQDEQPKINLDSKKVAKRAWSIFLGEVNEEGLTLIADKDARELARRSLKVAEIYCREEAIQLLKNDRKTKEKEDNK